MTYLEMLAYQERSMNEMLCYQWVGFRSEREAFRLALLDIRRILGWRLGSVRP